MIILKNSAGTPDSGYDSRYVASPRASDSSRRCGKAALWFESSAQRFEEQESKILLEPEPPSERREPAIAPDEPAEKPKK
ncbi:MAG: hypothetical protein HUU21_10275 [Polyangiaceae bacterium]|nr:hypothetical protein [Polyangiaceae bacterium]